MTKDYVLEEFSRTEDGWDFLAESIKKILTRQLNLAAKAKLESFEYEKGILIGLERALKIIQDARIEMRKESNA